MSGGEAERLARAALSRLFEPGEPRVTRAVASADGRRVLESVLEIEGVAPGSGEQDVRHDAAARMARLDPAAELERAARQGIRFVVPGDPEWPVGLDDLTSAGDVSSHGGPPVGLWVRGPITLDRLAGSVAVVGARDASSYGLELAREVGADVARAGVPVVSGGALGIDQAAHRGALAVGGLTVAFLAGGVDALYPRANIRLLEHLCRHSAVVSEAPPGTVAYKARFLARNRLIAAASAGTVVVEAALRSGALSTARWAESLSRPVMGVPGPVFSAQSQGVHQLIRSGAAALVTGGAEVLELVGSAGEHLVEVPRAAPRTRDALSRRQRKVLEAVPVGRPAGAESIADSAGVALIDVAASLHRLHERGFVEQVGHGWILGERARETG